MILIPKMYFTFHLNSTKHGAQVHFHVRVGGGGGVIRIPNGRMHSPMSQCLLRISLFCVTFEFKKCTEISTPHNRNRIVEGCPSPLQKEG